MKNKFLILLLYYNRPEFLKLALKSIKEHEYDNWELAVLDDGSEIPAEPITRDILHDKLDRITFYNTNDTIKERVKRNGANGSIVGKIAQEAIIDSTADYIFILCDDDMLYPNYMKNLDEYFTKHPEEKYVYSHIQIYDPLLHNIDEELKFIPHHLNKTEPVNPHFKLDASQVAWNRNAYVENNIQFPYPMTANMDAVIFNQMHNFFGKCKFSGFIGQYKAMYMGGYDDQLSHRMGKRISNQISDEDVYNIRIK